MAKIKLSKEQIEGKPNIPPGIYEIRLDGFKCKKSKNSESVNLNPVLKVTNDPNGHNDRVVFYNANTNFGPGLMDMCHGFGVRMENEGGEESDFPGEFDGPADKPEEWAYTGPLTSQIAKVEVVEDDYNGKKSMKIKRFFCAVAGCTTKHKEDLIGA